MSTIKAMNGYISLYMELCNHPTLVVRDIDENV